MNLGTTASVLLVAGVFAVLAAPLIPHLDNGSGRWSEQEATQLQAASQQYHAALLSSIHSHQEDGPSTEQELDAARADYEQQSDRLQSARSRGDRISVWLRRLGISMCAVGFSLGVVHRFLMEKN